MKLFYDEQGRITEILGSGENGDFTDNERELVTKIIDTNKELKEYAIEKQAEIQKEAVKIQGEVSKEAINKSSNCFSDSIQSNSYTDVLLRMRPKNLA